MVVADAGYGKNYEYLEGNAIEPYVKFNYLHKEQKRSFKNDAFHSQNLYYNASEDYFVCPIGQHMDKVGIRNRRLDSGYISRTSIYENKNCTGFPLKGLCYKSEENRRIEVNHNLNRYKERVRELLH